MSLTPVTLEVFMDGLSSSLADWSLETLLDFMEMALEGSQNPLIVLMFPWLKGYHLNVKPGEGRPDFEGVYVFCSNDDDFQACRVFSNGEMRKPSYTPEKYDMKIVFKNTETFWKFLFSGGDNILDSILENEVEARGNLNYLYKFGFMARDLVRRVDITGGLFH